MTRYIFKPLIPIATNTFREAVRSKVLGSLVFFVVLASVGTALLGEMSMHEDARVAADGALFMSTLFSVAISVYSMVTLLHNEMEQRTIYTILTKPIARWQFLVGKYLGVSSLLAAIVTMLWTLSLVLVTSQGGEITPSLHWAYLTLYLQCLIVTALTLAFASFSSPLLSGMLTVSLFVTGNLISQLEAAKATLSESLPFADAAVDILIIVLPNFESLNLSWFVTHPKAISLGYVGAAIWYTVSYVAVTMVLAIGIFSRRDLG